MTVSDKKMAAVLEMLRDIPDDQLADLAAMTEQQRKDIGEIYTKTQAELLRRMYERGASILVAKDWLCTKEAANAYAWDAAALSVELPANMVDEYLERVIPEPIPTPPPFWKVKSSTKLKNLAEKLGDQGLGTVIKAAMTVEEKTPKVTFKPIETAEVA